MKLSEADRTMLMWMVTMIVGLGAIALVGMSIDNLIDWMLRVING